MLSGLTPEHLSSPAVLLGVVVVLIVFGGLVPRWLHRSMLRIKDEAIADLKEINAEQARQIHRLIGGTEVSVRVSEALQERMLNEGGGN
ncbi:hypothetical protein Rruber_02665 [Rhodococcus ruber]|uniref:hypothetical protein n=1 Tax=Rhodococcus ruber TaxID=1830 RepID=UPI00315D445C